MNIWKSYGNIDGPCNMKITNKSPHGKNEINLGFEIAIESNVD